MLFDMNTTSWQTARKKLNLPVRIHDLKHTFGRRFRAANVSEENRRDLLGHKSHRITTHYSAAEIRNLIDAANKVCVRQTSTPTLGRMKAEAASLTIAERMQARKRAELERNWKHIPAKFRHGILRLSGSYC